jgi:hypothetical protein
MSEGSHIPSSALAEKMDVIANAMINSDFFIFISIFTLIYYLSSRKQKNFSLVDCVKSFIPISIVALLCFIMSYLNISLYDGRWLALLCVIALITAPIFLFVSSMIHTIRLFNVEQAEIKDYKAYIKKTLITITVYFVTNAVCIAFIILYAEIL